jgi:hypothetical protein
VIETSWWDPVGAENPSTSRDLRILMDQPTESISSHDTPIRHEDHGFAWSKRRRLPQGAMRTVDQTAQLRRD